MKENVLVFSIALKGYSTIFRNCIRSHQKYCKRHGFQYVCVKRSPGALSPSEAAWLKLFLLREALAKNYNWVAFIDADCEIRDHAPSFNRTFRKFPVDKSIFMAKGFSGRINSGVIFMKKQPGAIDYLKKVIENGDNAVPPEDEALYENGHMIHYGKNDPNIRIIEFAKWNNNRELNPESFIQHYSGGILRMGYINDRPFVRFYNFLLRSRKKYLGYFKKRKPSTTMAEINVLLNFYKKEYPEFR